MGTAVSWSGQLTMLLCGGGAVSLPIFCLSLDPVLAEEGSCGTPDLSPCCPVGFAACVL